MTTTRRDLRNRLALGSLGVLILAGCGSSNDVARSGDGGAGPGRDGGALPDGASGPGDASSDVPSFGQGDSSGGGPSDAGAGGDCAPNLTGRLRDFVNKPGFTPASALDDDFENASGDDRGIVQTDLGADQKPVYAHPNGMTATTHGQMQFDWWYRDTAGKNMPYNFQIVLTPGANGQQTYDNQEFFPLDGRGWNDEYIADDGMLHNFSFTFELHTTFGYGGGEVFTFVGDDDVFVFVSQKLVVDLGGVHGAETKSIQLDTLVTDDGQATPVVLTKGSTYPLDIFYNERHTVASHFRMDTSIGFNNCNPIIVPQ